MLFRFNNKDARAAFMGFIFVFCDVDFEYLDFLSFSTPSIFMQQHCRKIKQCAKKGYFCTSG